MAMGFSSTQRQPCPPPFWVFHSRSCSSSSRRFPASNKFLRRVELGTSHSSNGSFPNARRHSSFESRSSYKLEVGPDKTYPSKSSARLVLQTNITGIKVLDYINQPKEKERPFRHNNGEMVEAMGSNPLNRHRDVGSLPLAARNTSIKQLPSWTQLMKETKRKERPNINVGVDSESQFRVTEPLGRQNGNVSGFNKTVGHHLVEVLSFEKKVNRKSLDQLPSNDILIQQIPIKDKLNKPATTMIKSSTKGVDDSKEKDVHEMLSRIYEKVLVVDSPSVAKEVVKKLINEYRHLNYACDTEVAKIDVKKDTPVDHGQIICFSIYGGPKVDFGNGKSCIWVDVLDGGGNDILVEFAPFFEDSCIQKVWHNYSFDNHVIENYGIKLNGFHADTMHMARLWDSSRRNEGGYSLEALTGDKNIMSKNTNNPEEELIGKVSMKTIFGRNKVKKDGSEGKITNIPRVEELQREERKLWICYSALDSISTLKLYENMKFKLQKMEWHRDGVKKGNMFTFYKTHWRPFGELLVKMETEGMLVDRAYLAEVEKVAISEQHIAANRFHNWASTYCPDAKYMNVGSDTQLRQLLFGGSENRKDPKDILPKEKTFTVSNANKMTEGGPIPVKYRCIKLHKIGELIPTEIYTATGWPSLNGDALKALSGKVSAEYEPTDDWPDKDTSAYGTAYDAFGKGQAGKEACHAIAALCEVCSINSLISNFILPLQGSQIAGKNGRIHCSLNINTETGRLSARRPNLQNQPALEKDRYKIRKAFVAAPGNSLIVADYGQLELRILAHLAKCKSMLDAFKAGGDFHSRTAMNMYPHIREAVDKNQVLLEWDPQPGEDKPPVPLLKDAFASERRKAKMLNFSIAYGKTPVGLSKDWMVSVEEARNTVNLWYKERKEVRDWQKIQQEKANTEHCVHTLLGRARLFPSLEHASNAQKAHMERAAINAPVQGSAADVAMCAMLEIAKNKRLKKLGWKLLLQLIWASFCEQDYVLQVHDEVILEGPTASAEVAKAIVVKCMQKPFNGKNILDVDLSVDAKCAQNWYAAK